MKLSGLILVMIVTVFFVACGVDQQSAENNVTDNGANMTPSSEASAALNCTVKGNCFLFEGYDPHYGFEPWITDGQSGAFMMADTNTINDSSNPLNFLKVGNLIYFEAEDPAHGNELYRLDLTTSEVAFVGDFTLGINENFYQKYDCNGTLYFSDGSTLYRIEAPGKQAVVVDTGGSIDLLASTKMWFYYSKSKQLYRTDGVTVEAIDMTDPKRVQGVDSTLVIWKKEGDAYFDGPTELYVLDDDMSALQLIETYEYQYAPYEPHVLLIENGSIYFNSTAVGNMAISVYNYQIYRLDTHTKKVDIPLSFVYSEGGEYIYDLLADDDNIFILTSREYTSSQGYWSPETGAVYEPGGMFVALYRLDKNFDSKRLLHRFEKSGPTPNETHFFAQHKDKLYLYKSTYNDRAMYMYDTTQARLVQLEDITFEDYATHMIATTDAGVLYASKDAENNWSIDLLNYESDKSEPVTDFIVNTSYGSIAPFIYADNALYFQGNYDDTYGTELYKFDLSEEKKSLVENINDATKSSIWTTAVYSQYGGLMNTATALYYTDFSTENSLPIGEFDPFFHNPSSSYVNRNSHALSEILKYNNMFYIATPDNAGITTLYMSDGSFDSGLQKLWESGSQEDELSLLAALNGKLYFKLENRGYVYEWLYRSVRASSDEISYYSMDLQNNSVSAMAPDDPLLPILQNNTIIGQIGDTLFFDDNNTLVKLETSNNNDTIVTPIKNLNGKIIPAKGNTHGFYFFGYESIKTDYYYSDTNTTVSVWFSDGSQEGTKKLYTFQDINIGTYAVECIDSELIFVIYQYSWVCNDFGCTKDYTFKTYHMASSDSEPTLMINDVVSAFGRDGNPNIILLKKPFYSSDPFELHYWRYNLSTNNLEALDITNQAWGQ